MLPRTVPGMGDGSPVSRSCSFKCLFTQNIMRDKINQFSAEIFVRQKLTTFLHQYHSIFAAPQWSGLWHFPPLGDKEWGAWWGERKATECLWSGDQHHTSDNTHNDDEFTSSQSKKGLGRDWRIWTLATTTLYSFLASLRCQWGHLPSWQFHKYQSDPSYSSF